MKKVIMYTLLLMSSLFIFSCQEETRTTTELDQIFNKKELKDINTIVSFYEERLKKQANTDQVDSAFHKFAKQNVYQLEYNFSGFDTKSLQQLYSNIDSKTYDQIWSEYSGYSYEINDSIKIFTVAYEKKFMKYMKLVGEENPKIGHVHGKIEASGSVDGFFLNTLYQDFDSNGMNARFSKKIGDFNHRFATAVITIIVAENIRRDEKIRERASKMQQAEKEN